MPDRSPAPARMLSVDDLGLREYLNGAAEESLVEPELGSSLDEADGILVDVLQAFQDGFAGVIFVGPPGTSKSWYASGVALALTEGDSSRVRYVQFHPSFQYEDFIEGYVPRDSGKFELMPKHLRLVCERAVDDPQNTHVLVIDEISRCDAARVFGEALTYIEMTKRGMTFTLSSGTQMQIPRNVRILATMNPWDRGVDDIDFALSRRFCHIAMDPNTAMLRQILSQGSFRQDTIDAVVRFFEAVQRLQNPLCRIGHAYFLPARDEESLERLWRMQLKHHFARACRLDTSELTRIERMWTQFVGPAIGTAPTEAEAEQRTEAPDLTSD